MGGRIDGGRGAAEGRFAGALLGVAGALFGREDSPFGRVDAGADAGAELERSGAGSATGGMRVERPRKGLAGAVDCGPAPAGDGARDGGVSPGLFGAGAPPNMFGGELGSPPIALRAPPNLLGSNGAGELDAGASSRGLRSGMGVTCWVIAVPDTATLPGAVITTARGAAASIGAIAGGAAGSLTVGGPSPSLLLVLSRANSVALASEGIGARALEATGALEAAGALAAGSLAGAAPRATLVAAASEFG